MAKMAPLFFFWNILGYLFFHEWFFFNFTYFADGKNFGKSTSGNNFLQRGNHVHGGYLGYRCT